MSERVRTRGGARFPTIGAILAIVCAPAAAIADAAHTDVTTDCTFLEISAKLGDKPVIDDALKRVEKKLKKPPFSTWNQFKLLSHSERSLVKKKVEPIALKVGSATATLVEIVDKSKVRLTITMDVGGKQVVNTTTTTVEAGDYVMFVHELAGNEGHLLSLTCK